MFLALTLLEYVAVDLCPIWEKRDILQANLAS